jgi:hypothetical protein
MSTPNTQPSTFALFIACQKRQHRNTIAQTARSKAKAARHPYLSAVREEFPGLFTLVGRRVMLADKWKQREYTVILKVRAASCRDAVEAAARLLNEGGEPDAVLTCPVSFPDPEMEGAMVTL